MRKVLLVFGLGVALAACTTQGKLRRSFAEGLEHQRLGRDEKARLSYDELLEIAPEYPGARTNRAVLDARSDKLDEALAGLQAELRRHGDLRAARVNEALVLLLQDDAPAAANKAAALAEQAPADPNAHLVLGLALLRTGENPGTAAEAFGVVIAGDRDALKAQAHFGRGVVRARRGESAAAAEDFAAAASLRPDAVARFNRSVVLAREGQIVEALSAIEGAAKLDTRAAQIPLQAARLHLLAGDDAAARTALERSVALNPEQPGQALIAGVLAYRARDWKAALTAFERAAAEAPESAIPHFNLGLTFLALDDLKGAHTAFTEAARRDPADRQAAHNRDVLGKLLQG